MIPGASITFGGVEYTVPPINLRISYLPEMDLLCKPSGEVDFLDYVKAASTVLFALFQRNYPEMTRSQFDELIDLPMLKPVIAGLLQISGYAARPLELATVQPVSEPAELTSSVTSSTPPDGSPETSSIS